MTRVGDVAVFREPQEENPATNDEPRDTAFRITDSRITDSRITDSRITDSRITENRELRTGNGHPGFIDLSIGRGAKKFI
jgi:hypothetical protein